MIFPRRALLDQHLTVADQEHGHGFVPKPFHMRFKLFDRGQGAVHPSGDHRRHDALIASNPL